MLRQTTSRAVTKANLDDMNPHKLSAAALGATYSKSRRIAWNSRLMLTQARRRRSDMVVMVEGAYEDEVVLPATLLRALPMALSIKSACSAARYSADSAATTSRASSNSSRQGSWCLPSPVWKVGNLV
mmetsp:Transcript_20648/g.62209  ORF Transcript_20648/g.62209 Transcript_20648/m.62209 type:complete len:128 (+) Transcript_20648:294-677(+)